jgi:cell division septal protein FtsQ
MPRKRKRRRINWGPVVLLLLVGNLTAGAFFSKLTSVAAVQVYGVPVWDQSRVSYALQALQDKPALQTDPRRLETAVQWHPEVDHADFSRNVLGRGTLKVRYRTPVARISGAGMVAITAEGTVYKAHVLPDRLPVLELPADAAQPMVGMIGNWLSQDVANVCDQIRDLALNRTVVVSLDAQGGVNLRMGSGGIVQLGRPVDLDEKLTLLRDMLGEDPACLDNLEYLDLKAPDRPQQKLKNQVRQQ